MHLRQRLLSLIGLDQRLVVDFRDRLPAHSLEDGGGGVLAELWVDWSKHRVLAHHYLRAARAISVPPDIA